MLFNFIKNKSGFIIRIIFFIVVIACTVMLFPRKGKFMYEFQKGSPWRHDNLIAEYDFPIYKSQQQFEIEKNSILLQFYPYYNYNNEIGNANIDKFTVEFKLIVDESVIEYKETSSLSDRKIKRIEDTFIEYGKYVKGIINKIYISGIINISDFSDKLDTTVQKIVVLKDKIGDEFDLSEIYTQKSAYEYIVQNANKFEYDDVDLPDINFEKYLEPNLYFNQVISNKVKTQLINDVSPVNGMVQSGERIIFRGELIDDERFLILESLKKEYESSSGALVDESIVLLGQIILVLSAFSIVFFYLFYFYPDVLKSTRQVLYMLSFQLIFIITTALFTSSEFIDIYLIPITILPVLTTTFYNARLALLQHTVTILILGFLVANGFEYVFIQFIVGFVAVLGISKLHTRRQIISTSGLIFTAYVFLYTGITVIHEGDISRVDLYKFAWFAGSSVLVLMSYPLIYLLEKLFGFVSDVTLLELSDTNRPLLRLLSEKAPGTFQHSVLVANLTEAAVREIKGNVFLARAGALYHDIGKIESPVFFTENQHSKLSPHDKLNPIQSADVIVNHVIAGEKLAKKYRVPSEIIDFIKTHHGNGNVKWFLHSFKKQNPDIEIDKNMFSYPGPLPFSKETAVVMMADSIEASSRSLVDFNESAISNLVEKVIDTQMSEKLFDKADITFAEISKIKEVFKSKLQNIYHTRIKYPDEK